MSKSNVKLKDISDVIVHGVDDWQQLNNLLLDTIRQQNLNFLQHC